MKEETKNFLGLWCLAMGFGIISTALVTFFADASRIEAIIVGLICYFGILSDTKVIK